MNRIWAPWRKAYIRPDKKKSRGCLFCRFASATSKDVPNLVLKRSRHAFAVLNLYPYNNGHVLIIPNRHVDNLEKLSDEEKLDWLALYEKVQKSLKRSLKAQGFNVGLNLGRAAGAGIPKHLHLHVVPRWKGDLNFMPVIGATKVISESLASVYEILSADLKSAKSNTYKTKRSRGGKR